MEFKSVVTIGPNDTDEQAVTKFMDWYRDNQSAVADKNVPNVEETRRMLAGYSK